MNENVLVNGIAESGKGFSPSSLHLSSFFLPLFLFLHSHSLLIVILSKSLFSICCIVMIVPCAAQIVFVVLFFLRMICKEIDGRK